MRRDGSRYRIVLVTCGSIQEARRMGRVVVEKKLAACANIVPRIESIYRWKGKVERAREVLMLLKTSAARVPQLEREIERAHSYDLPEFVVLPIEAVSKEYLRWIADSTG